MIKTFKTWRKLHLGLQLMQDFVLFTQGQYNNYVTV